MESLEDRRVLATLYVDNAADYMITNDQGAGGLDNGDEVTWDTAGTHADGPQAGLIFGDNAFANITDAVNEADPGDVINIAAGTFNEDVVINTPVSLIGAQAGVDGTVAPGARGLESTIDPNSAFGVVVNADNVTIDGFEFTDLNREAINVRPTNSAAGVSTRDNITIANNYIHQTMVSGNQVNGIVFGESNTGESTDDATISNVSITGNVIDVTDDGTARGIVMTGHFATITYTDIAVNNNTIQAKNNGLFASENPAIYEINNLDITNNRFERPGSTGINIGNLDSDSSINSNIFTDNASGAAVNFREAGGEIIGNTFSNHTNVGLAFFDETFFPQSSADATVTGNVFTDNVRQVAAPAVDVDLDAIQDNNTFDGGVRVSSNRNFYGNIQAAVDAAANNDTVTVQAGNYIENVSINKPISLLSDTGRANTTITGITGSARGTVRVSGTTSGVTIGTTGQGFAIVGIDDPTPAIEGAAVQFSGTHSNVTIQDNEIVANGGAGLLSDYANTIDTWLIDNNIFSGQTFVGANPAGDGFDAQFSLANVPRQLVALGNGGGNSGSANATNITFTNNQLTGTAGGTSTTDNSGNTVTAHEQGNTLVTLDVANSTISGNTFAGTTNRFSSALRVRRPDTAITGNTFDTSNMTPTTSVLFLQNNTTPVQTVALNNMLDKGAYIEGGNTVWPTIQAPLFFAASGDTVGVLAGTYAENVVVTNGTSDLGTVTINGEIGATVDPASGNAFTIPANVTALFTGSFTTTDPTVVQADGTIGGTGTITGPVTIEAGGTASPGFSPEIMNTGDYTQMGTLDIEANSPATPPPVAGTDYDQINVTGTVTLGGPLEVILGGAYPPVPNGTVLTIINNDMADAVSGTFDGLPNGATFDESGQAFQVFYNGGGGNDVTLVAVSALAPDTTYADDQASDYTVTNDTGSPGLSNGDTVTWNGSTPVTDLIFGFEAFLEAGEAIDAVNPDGTVNLAPGTYTEDQQIVIDSNVTINGDDPANTTLQAGFNTGSGGDARGFILVDEGINFSVNNLAIDGNGFMVHQGIRHKGSGTFDNVTFNDIQFGTYNGIAIAAFGSTSDIDVSNSTFTDIGRIGVLYFGSGTTGTFQGNTYTGKGAGDHLDYALDISNGANIDVLDNVITNNLGVASSDDSVSAGVLVTTFFGDGTTALVQGNFINGNSYGVFVGYDDNDMSDVTVTENDLSGNVDGAIVSTNEPFSTDTNWFGTTDLEAVDDLILGNVQVNSILTSGDADSDPSNGFQVPAAPNLIVTLFVPDDDGANNAEVRRNGSGEIELLLDSAVVSTTPISEIVSIGVLGADESAMNADDEADSLLVNYNGPGGFFGKPIEFIGGDGASDALSVVGSGSETAIYTPDATVTGNGTVLMNGTATITFTGLEPVDMSGMMTATVMLPGDDDVLEIANGFDDNTGTVPAIVVSGTTGGVAIESAHLFNNTNVVIDTTADDGDDTITLTSADNAHGNTNLSINTGAGTDLLDVNGAATVAGTFDGQVSNIELNADIAAATITGTAMTVEVESGAAQIADAIDLSASGGTVNINADVYSGDLDTTSKDIDVTLENGPAQVSVLNAALNAGDSLQIEIDGTAGAGVAGGHDQLVATTSVALNGVTLDTTGSDIVSATNGDLFTIIDNQGAGTVTGTFAGIDEGDVFMIGGETFQISYQGGTGNDVVLRVVDPAAPALNGTSMDDTFVVTDDGAQLLVSLNGNNIYSGPQSTPITLNGLAGNDSVTIDNTMTTQVTADVTFNGLADEDNISVLGGTATDLIYTPNAGTGDTARGTIELDAQTITFTGLEPALVTTSATNVTIDLSSLAADETVTLSDDGGVANGLSRVSFASNTLEDLDFMNPTDQLEVIADGNATVDTVNVEGLDSGFDADLTISGGTNDSTTFQTASTDIGSGMLSVTSGTIAIAADVTTTADAVLDATTADISGAGTLSANDLTADAVTGIQLNTTVATIDASTSGSGDVDIAETDMVTLTDVDTSAGDIDVTAGGNLTATDVVAGGSGEVTLSTDAGSGADVLVDLVTAEGNLISITADGAIEEDTPDAGVDLTASNLDLTSNTGIGALDPIEIDADAGAGQGLDATVNTAGDIQLDDVDELRIQSLSGPASATIDTGGEATIVGTASTDSDLTIISQAGISVESGAFVSTTFGNVDFTANGGSIDVNSTISSGGTVDLDASDSITLDASVSATTTFTSEAENDTTITSFGSIFTDGLTSITTNSGMIDVSGTVMTTIGGDIEIDAGSSVFVDAFVSSAGNVTIDAGTTFELNDFASIDGSGDITVTSGGAQTIRGSLGGFVSNNNVELDSGASIDITGFGSVSGFSDATLTSVTNTTIDGGTVSGFNGSVDAMAGGDFSLINFGTVDAGLDLSISAGGDLLIEEGTSVSAQLGDVTLSGGQAGGGSAITLSGLISGDSITINGGAGADTITIDENGGTLGDGGTVENLQELQGNILINAGGGDDSLLLDDSGSTDADTVDVNQGQGKQIIGLHESSTFTYSDLENVELFAGVDSDTFNVQLSPDTAFIVNGNDPEVPTTPGDQLNILTSDGLDLPFVFAATTDGSLTDAPDQTITWTSIESFTIDNNDFIVGDLYVITDDGPDRIIFFSTNGTDTEVRIGNDFYGPFAIPAGNRMVAFSQGGNDTIVVQGLVPPIAEFHGGSGNDYLAGTTGDDFLIGDLGNDIILGGEGDNFIHGDDPSDPTVGGNDRLEGRDDDDIIIGGAGNDRIQGRGGEDTLDGGDGNDQLFGGLGDDFSFGGLGGGFDLIRDSFGDDVIFGGGGIDQLFGGDGNDLIIAGTGADRLRGDGGNDYLANGSSSQEAAIDAALADLAANAIERPTVPPTQYNANVLPGLTAWRTSNTVAFGTLMDDDDPLLDSIDDMTGGVGTDIFDAAPEDMIRDLRTSEGDTEV